MKLIKFSFLLILATNIQGQKTVLYMNKQVALWPFENRYMFYIPNSTCSSIIFKTDNGKINQDGCSLFYYPDTLKKTTFKVYKKTKNTLILFDSVQINVTINNKAQASIGMKSGGSISKKEVLAIGGLLVTKFISDSHEEPIRLISYKVITIRGDAVESATNYGNHFSEKAIEIIKALGRNDKLLFVDINSEEQSNRPVCVAPLEFTLQ